MYRRCKVGFRPRTLEDADAGVERMREAMRRKASVVMMIADWRGVEGQRRVDVVVVIGELFL